MSYNTTEWTRVEGIGRRVHDTDLVTQYPLGAGGGVGGGTLSTAAMKFCGRNHTGG